MCFPAPLLQAFQNALYKAYNSRLKQKQEDRIPAGKTGTLKMKPSCERSPYPELFVTPAGIHDVHSYRNFVVQK